MEDKYLARTYVVKIADTPNYFNEKHRIIRVDINGGFFDFLYDGYPIVPNPKYHLILLTTCEEYLDKTMGIKGETVNYLPGCTNELGTIGDINLGICRPIPIGLEVTGTNPPAGGAGFSISNINMYDIEKVAIALTPPFESTYTNTDKTIDLKDLNTGFFINNDGTILIKSRGGSMTIGKEGIYFGGNINWENSEHAREWLMGNTLHRFIPATIVTPMAMPEIPNYSKFQELAEAARKVRNVVEKGIRVNEVLNRNI